MRQPRLQRVSILLPHSGNYNSETANVLWLFKEALKGIGISCWFSIPQEGESLRITLSQKRV